MIYLNNAATTYPKPKEVLDALTSYLINVPSYTSRGGPEKSESDFLFSCRKNVASFFHIPNPIDLIFTSSATESLNLVILGLELKGHVITTQIEHNSVLRPLTMLQKKKAIDLTIVECDQYGYVSPQSIVKFIRKDTRAIIVNHCSNVTGETQDIASISQIASDAGIIFIVDGSQSAGNIKIDVLDQKIDILAFAGHKSLYGIPGIGGLYIHERLCPKPLKYGGTGIKSESLDQPPERPIYYEAGTPNLPGIVALSAGIDFITKTGIQVIIERKQRLVERLVEGLKKQKKVVLYSNHEKRPGSHICCFNILGMDPGELGYILHQSFDIIVRTGLHCAPLIHQALKTFPRGCVRVSPSYFTKEEEIDFFVDSINKICHMI